MSKIKPVFWKLHTSTRRICVVYGNAGKRNRISTFGGVYLISSCDWSTLNNMKKTFRQFLSPPRAKREPHILPLGQSRDRGMGGTCCSKNLTRWHSNQIHNLLLFLPSYQPIQKFQFCLFIQSGLLQTCLIETANEAVNEFSFPVCGIHTLIEKRNQFMKDPTILKWKGSILVNGIETYRE